MAGNVRQRKVRNLKPWQFATEEQAPLRALYEDLYEELYEEYCDLLQEAYVDINDLLTLVEGLKTEVNALNVKHIEVIIDGGGAVITTGVKHSIKMPCSGEILACYLVADQSGDIVIDVWKDKYANLLPTDADSITASDTPTLTTALKMVNVALTGWTKIFNEDEWFTFNVDSCTTITRVTVVLIVRKTKWQSIL